MGVALAWRGGKKRRRFAPFSGPVGQFPWSGPGSFSSGVSLVSRRPFWSGPCGPLSGLGLLGLASGPAFPPAGGPAGPSSGAVCPVLCFSGSGPALGFWLPWVPLGWVLGVLVPHFSPPSGLFVRSWPKHKVARPQFSHSSRSRSFSCSRSLLLGITSPRWLCAFTTTSSASLARKGVVGSKWASPWPDYTLQSVWTGQQVGVALALQSVWTSLRLKTVLRGSKWAAPWPTQH